MQALLEINGSLNITGYAVATIASVLGVAWIFASVVDGATRQPEARGAVISITFIGFAAVEALAIIAITLAFVLQ